MTETAEKKDVVPGAYRERYKATGGNNGDFIADALSKVAKDGPEALATIKAENGIAKDRWSGFNPGMVRMNLANVLRGSFLKGETIKILGKEYNAKHLAEDFNGELKDTDAQLTKLAHLLGLPEKGDVSARTIAALRKLFFPPAPKGKTAEQRAADEAAKEAEKVKNAKAKAVTKAEGVLTKAKDAAKSAHEKLDTAKSALEEARGNAAKADEAGKAAADKAVSAASTTYNRVEKSAEKADEKVAEAEKALAAAKA